MGGALSHSVGLSPTAAGAAAWPSLIGAEMMVNGDCSSDTGWQLNFTPGITFVGGKMLLAAVADGSFIGNDGVSSLVIDGTYRCVYTIDSRTSGAVQISIGATLGTSHNAAGTFSEDLVSGGIEWSLNMVGTTTMQLDNFSVKGVGLMGVEADWSFSSGEAFWAITGIVFDGSTVGTTAQLTGAAKTSFDAAVSSNTACSVTLYQNAGDPQNGTVSVTMKGGTPVNFVFAGDASISHTVTSGSGSGFILTAGSDFPGITVTRVQIALA